jgi:putative membrane protein
MKTNSTFPLRCAAIMVAASLLTSLSAQTPATPKNTDRPDASMRQDNNKLDHGDRAFFEKAAKSGMKEVDVSQAVASRLTDAQVRNFAQSMISDHSSANSELTALAARKGVVLPADKMKATEKWSKKDHDLDGDYLKEMEDDHEEAVKLFEKASKSDDADIASFAQKTLPTLRHHLEMVRTLRKTIK